MEYLKSKLDINRFQLKEHELKHYTYGRTTFDATVLWELFSKVIHEQYPSWELETIRDLLDSDSIEPFILRIAVNLTIRANSTNEQYKRTDEECLRGALGVDEYQKIISDWYTKHTQ